jgi:hypothetical protein
MKNLLIVGVFVAIFVYVARKTSAPMTVTVSGNAPTAPPSNAPSVGPSDGQNTYPGMAGATYTPVPGSPGLLQRVVNSTFVPSAGVRAAPPNVT